MSNSEGDNIGTRPNRTELGIYMLNACSTIEPKIIDKFAATNSSPICIVNTLRADLVTKRITLSSSDKGVTKDPFCKGSDKLSTAVLWGLEDTTKDAVERAKSKK